MVTNGNAKTLEAHISIFKHNSSIIHDVASIEVAEYMISFLKMMNAGDLWPVARAKILMNPELIESDDFMSIKEKQFFELASLLSQESRWKDLLHDFFR